VQLAAAYKEWYKSNPFDIGHTTRSGLRTLCEGPLDAKMVEYCWANVNKNNFNSQSNGSLMRSTPISVYGHLLPLNELRSIIKQDNNFTHCHANVIDSVYLYSVAIGSLIRHGDKPDRALTAFNDA
jgi:ADP-ribosyl-[dinitrogen reductase] hydrolase